MGAHCCRNARRRRGPDPSSRRNRPALRPFVTLTPSLTREQLLDQLQQSPHPGKPARDYLEREQARLYERFHDTPIRELVNGRAQVVDDVLVCAWQFCTLSTQPRSEEHTSELQSRENLVCRLLLE